MKDNETKTTKIAGWGGNVTRKEVKGKGFPYDYDKSHHSTTDDKNPDGNKVPKEK